MASDMLCYPGGTDRGESDRTGPGPDVDRLYDGSHPVPTASTTDRVWCRTDVRSAR
ncbi:hypothetical protein D2E29_15325 [Mycobacteroides abscessus]|uniref:Uncharacterized protein n=3 Tax=Mycobacteroides abscessus TaxID=36809 RepID=B1MKN4_MYCA9|nr:hypothetical protein MASS_1236 [Mycobacteroides abscessus subsp. bolletii 50594]AWG52751.1 hypothetical protein DDT48_23650 [Mycobacteroides abscessus]QBE77059.1 hypothetical protein EXM25_06155 [Mycobacteroides abscessus subsp. massiliense]RTZ42185.1 hypothetical protein CJN95_024980 [Mycobacteroides abscessus subsp. abscessus]CAM61326.1 Hypothetical protein MAB_1238 [Mycobacteroides abscessus ATCC 19977]